MKLGRGVPIAVLTLWLGAAGCSTMREIPRAEYAVRPERNAVRIETDTGEQLEFESARFSADSLTGVRRRESEGSFEEVDSRVLALERVKKLQTRQIDWYRTGLLGGVLVAAIVAAVLSQTNGGDGGSTDNGPCGARPCP